ncbi:hypothetical protein VTL71DRAFT_16564 [Oculimacula yallundae]|uniref:Uncharacterized protein n=1 Tax=Oculimacula yallundae TaxID=86028 RepID=A0ABR4CG29_9HELO
MDLTERIDPSLPVTPSQIEILLAAEKLHDLLPLTDANSLFKLFQSLFLVECPSNDLKILQDIQLTAAFLEYLSTQRILRVRELLRAWQITMAEPRLDGTKKEAIIKEGKEGKHGEKKGDDFLMSDVLEEKTSDLADAMTLDEIATYIRNRVNDVCVYFEGQDVNALAKLDEVEKKIADILNQSKTWFWPRFSCERMEAF